MTDLGSPERQQLAAAIDSALYFDEVAPYRRRLASERLADVVLAWLLAEGWVRDE